MFHFRHRHHRPGTAPGTLTSWPESESAPPPRLTLFDYNQQTINEKADGSLADCTVLRGSDNTVWIHIQGIPRTELIAQLGRAYGLHALALEDVVNAEQRSKVDVYEEHCFIVMNHLARDGQDQLKSEQVSIFLGANFVISIHNGDADILEPVRTRLRKQGTRMRKLGADYLAYALLDTIIDNGFPMLGDMGERLESLELDLLENPESSILQRIHVIKRELIMMRRAFWPQREAMNTLIREDDALINESTRLYLRDCYDHTIQILELTEAYRETAAGMLDVYLSSLSNRTNEIMRVLTIIATIFIPLTFVVGVYGMNFNASKSPWNMPELNWYFGYPYALGVMALIVIGMLVYFRRRKWI